MTTPPTAAAADAEFEQLLEHLRDTRGFDFTGYKRSSLARRISKRMQELGIESYAAYLDHLELHPDEFGVLFNTILINVTSFFRDADAWTHLETTVLPELLRSTADGPVRVWCAGCASGQETYSLAMVLAEALGEDDFLRRVKIYATDVDEDALEAARAASYSNRELEGLSEERLQRFFDRTEQRAGFRKDLRRAIIFGRNDLLQDAPISRIDLLSCRNTLMYFNAETQARVLARFSFALRPHGVMLLGKSEMLLTHSELFKPLDLRRRIFQRAATVTRRERLVSAAQLEVAAGGGGLQEAAYDASPVAELTVDPDGVVVSVNRQARTLLGVVGSDVGRPLKDLELSYRPVELRGPLEQVLRERRPEVLPTAGIATEGGERVVRVGIVPLQASDALLGAAITFEDVTERHHAERELDRSKRELETAYEELQSTVEELETTNEELQSTNEELETTNEELQSTNEELETMNEELQSTNEELETINDELRQRSVELDSLSSFMETMLSSLRLAVAVLDADQVVRVWNEHATDLWGLRADEVEGTRFFGLDIGLPLDGLRADVRAVLADGDTVETSVEATNRRGRTIVCRVQVVPLRRDGVAPGAIVVMEQVDDRPEEASR